MKAKRRWRRALARARRLMDCMYNGGAGHRCPIIEREPGCYTPEWYMFGHNGLASLALDGMPSTPKRPRAAGKGRI